MIRRWWVATALAALGGAAAAAPGTGGPAAPGLDAAVRRVFPALVRVHAVVSSFDEGREERTEVAGSGVVVSPQGYVVTNHHVAGRARRISCTLPDRREVDAALVGSDPLSDIAVLRLDPAAGPYAAAAWGDPRRLRVGQPVLAMGSPLALSQSVTQGIVSNTAMVLPQLLRAGSFRLDGEEVGSLVQWIGHDAPIYPGNSGGPLVDLRGEVVGINEISVGLAGAIPADLARTVAEQLIRRGEVRRSWLGLEIQPLLKGSAGPGALVASVAPGSPAERAGLRPGDVLRTFQGAPVDVRHPEELPGFNRRLLETPVGTEVTWTALREGRELRGRAVTVARGAAQGEEVELRALGVTVRDLTLLAARARRRDPGSGVLVTGVRSGSPAGEAKPPLRADDVVVSADGRRLRSWRELGEAISAPPSGPRPPVVLGFERQGQALLTVVRPGGRDEADRSVEARRAWLAVSTQVLGPELAEALGLKGKPGVRVTQVQPGSAAEAAGLRPGDVLLRLDGEAIPAARAEDGDVFAALLRSHQVGARVRLEGVRDGAPLALEVELTASPPSARELVEYRDPQFEFSVRDLGVQDRLQQQLEAGQAGALVTRVEAGGWAALARLAVGDVILAVDGAPVADATALRAAMERIAAGHPAHVVLLVLRRVETRFLELEPAWPAPAAALTQHEEKGRTP